MKTLTTAEELLDYWPGDIPFKGSLISHDGCMDAQGQVLHFLGGVSPDQLRNYEQEQADKDVAKLLGISIAHSTLLRIVNDSMPGVPSDVIRDPSKILGDQAEIVLAFWRHIDSMSPLARSAAWTAAGSAAGYAAVNAAGFAARSAAWTAAGDAAGRAAGYATNEIQGASVMKKNKQPFFFLPMFGFDTPKDIPLD